MYQNFILLGGKNLYEIKRVTLRYIIPFRNFGFLNGIVYIAFKVDLPAGNQ